MDSGGGPAGGILPGGVLVGSGAPPSFPTLHASPSMGGGGGDGGGGGGGGVPNTLAPGGVATRDGGFMQTHGGNGGILPGQGVTNTLAPSVQALQAQGMAPFSGTPGVPNTLAPVGSPGFVPQNFFPGAAGSTAMTGNGAGSFFPPSGQVTNNLANQGPNVASATPFQFAPASGAPIFGSPGNPGGIGILPPRPPVGVAGPVTSAGGSGSAPFPDNPLPTTTTAPNPTAPANPTGNPAAGSPLGAGVNDSQGSLLPPGFSESSLTGPVLANPTTPDATAYVNQEKGETQGPTNWNVTPDQTVAGQYAKLMAQGNPAIQAAEQASIRANAASGGNNSLMAQSAASLAGSQVALTIAQQDAQVNAAAGQFNAAAANTFAQQQDQFVQNATLSQQNYAQGVAMLQAQTNQGIEQLYAQIQGSAASASIAVQQTLQQTQISLNATMAQMKEQFSENTSAAWQNYGMSVGMGYLSSLNTQQTALMATIGNINANPNITSAQAAAAITQAVQEFNSFMTMNNAYYASMMPNSNTAASGQYDINFPNG